MKKIILLSALLITGLAAGCGDDKPFDPSAFADSNEPGNDNYAGAVLMEPAPQDTAAGNTFHEPCDYDWFYFIASGTDSYSIATLNLGSDCDTVIYIYTDPENPPVLLNDDYASEKSSYVWYDTPPAQEIYVLVVHKCCESGLNECGDALGRLTAYDLKIYVDN